MKIDANSPTPIYLQIAEGIQSAIASGIYQAGEEVPSTPRVVAGVESESQHGATGL